MKRIWAFSLGLVLLSVSTAASALEMEIEAVMSPKEQIRLDFADGSKQFVLMVRREGSAKGTGPFSGAAVTEYGFHPITPGIGGDPHGYLVFSSRGGDIAYVKWQVRAVFVPGSGGNPKLLDNGVWEVVGASGAFKGLKGAGILHIKPVTKTDRRFILRGEIASPS